MGVAASGANISTSSNEEKFNTDLSNEIKNSCQNSTNAENNLSCDGDLNISGNASINQETTITSSCAVEASTNLIKKRVYEQNATAVAGPTGSPAPFTISTSALNISESDNTRQIDEKVRNFVENTVGNNTNLKNVIEVGGNCILSDNANITQAHEAVIDALMDSGVIVNDSSTATQGASSASGTGGNGMLGYIVGIIAVVLILVIILIYMSSDESPVKNYRRMRNISRMYYAPRGNAPRGNAPRGNAPRGNAPRMNAPRGNAPRVNAPRMNAPRGNGRGGRVY